MAPIASTLLIVITSLISFLAFEDPAMEAKYIFRPEDILARKEYYRLLTSGFLHAGWAHLLINMYTLYGFGGAVEMFYGPTGFLEIYLGSILGGNLLSLSIHRFHDYAAYGASGGVCGVLFAYVLHVPHSSMAIFPLPYALPGWLYAIAFLVASFYALRAAKDNIGHDAHLGGAMLGLVIAASLHPMVARRHWIALAGMLLVAGMILTYLLLNPLFLPLSSFIRWPPWPPWPAKTARPYQARRKVGRASPRPRAQPPSQPRLAETSATQSDWLIQEIEVQVGKLEKDKKGAHDWLDKFGRTYDVIVGRADRFEPQSFTASVLHRLKQPGVNFVIVDTRRLQDSQVALLRPVFARLPDAEFNRVIRSFAFKQR
jgi:membrane associated rhomboid family serine protease